MMDVGDFLASLVKNACINDYVVILGTGIFIRFLVVLIDSKLY